MDSGKRTPKISVIIPTWNRRDLVLRCLGSLKEQSFRDFETIVVDDGSTDDTVEAVGQDYIDVRMVEMGENQRFAAAVNAGIVSARGEWVFLLNNDVTLDPECLRLLLDGAIAAEADMAAPLILWRDEPERIYSAGDRINVAGRPEAIGFRALRADFQLPRAIFGVSAAAGLYRRAIFDAVGLLDPSFDAYFEDADLCFRARLAGFDAALVPAAVAYHIGSASIEGQTWWRSVQCLRNHGLLLIKNMPAPLIGRHFFRIIRERLHQLGCAFSASRCAFGAVRAVGVILWTAGGFFRRVPATREDFFLEVYENVSGNALEDGGAAGAARAENRVPLMVERHSHQSERGDATWNVLFADGRVEAMRAEAIAEGVEPYMDYR